MPRKCSVISCSSLKENPSITLFKVPKCSLDTWKEVIYRVNGGDKRKVTFVCSEHFTSEDLITSYASLPKDIEDFVGKRDRCGLKKGAIPSIFKNSTDTFNINCITTDSLNNAELSKSVGEQLSRQKSTTQIVQYVGQKKDTIPLVDTSKINNTFDPLKSLEHNAPIKLQCEQACTTLTVLQQLEGFKELLLSIGWLFYTDRFIVSMYKPGKAVSGDIRIVVEKQIIFQSNSLDIMYYINHKRIDPKILGLQQLTYPLDTTQVTKTIMVFHCKNICQGGPCIDNFPEIRVKIAHLEDGKIWYHNKCSIVTQSKKRCDKCNYLIPYFATCKRRLMSRKNNPCVQSTPKSTKHVNQIMKSKNSIGMFEEKSETVEEIVLL